MRSPRPTINTFPTLSQKLAVFAFFYVDIWHKEANYTEECVRFINLHDVTKSNKREDISRNHESFLESIFYLIYLLSFSGWKLSLQAVRKTTPSSVIYNSVTLHQ